MSDEITERDSQEFINAIRTSIKLPETRINNLESKGE